MNSLRNHVCFSHVFHLIARKRGHKLMEGSACFPVHFHTRAAQVSLLPPGPRCRTTGEQLSVEHSGAKPTSSCLCSGPSPRCSCFPGEVSQMTCLTVFPPCSHLSARRVQVNLPQHQSPVALLPQKLPSDPVSSPCQAFKAVKLLNNLVW